MQTYDDFTWVGRAELESQALCTNPWGWYLQTKVYFENSTPRGIVCPVDSDGEDLPPLGPLHVITAVQPQSDPASDESIARLGVLDRELAAANICSIPVVGVSFDGSHQEKSRAVFGLDDAQACKLGVRFGQVAVFSWSGPRWSLLASVGNRETHRAWRWETSS